MFLFTLYLQTKVWKYFLYRGLLKVKIVIENLICIYGPLGIGYSDSTIDHRVLDTRTFDAIFE
jgi:hypothetical protein